MSIHHHWTLQCPVCKEPMVAGQPDAEFRCGRCGVVRPGVAASRARTLERVTLGTSEFLQHRGTDPEHGGLLHTLDGLLARLLRRPDRRSTLAATDGSQPIAAAVLPLPLPVPSAPAPLP